MKRFFYLTLAAIAVMSTLTSCDKDELIITDPQPIYFRIVDANHIDLYDQGENVYERGRDVEFQISEQMPQNRIASTPLQALEGLEMEVDPFSTERFGVAIIVDVNFNHFTNSLKINGLRIEGKDALGNDFYVVCLNNVFLRGEIVTEETQKSPFLQAGSIHYTLYIIKKGEEIVLAETDQEFRICESIEDIEF